MKEQNNDLLPENSAFGTDFSDPEWARNICMGIDEKRCAGKLQNMDTMLRSAPSYKTLACIIPKNMSTLLQALMCFLFDEKTFRQSKRVFSLEGYDIRLCLNKNEYNTTMEAEKSLNLIQDEINNWLYLAIVRDPVEKFLSAYVDKCVRQPRVNGCNGCNRNMTCFIITEYERIMENSFLALSSSTFEDVHFFPQSWQCNFASRLLKYKFLHYTSDPQNSGKFLNGLLHLLRTQNVPEESLQFIQNQITGGRTVQSTVTSDARVFYEQRLRSSPFLMEYVIRMYFWDYKLLGFSKTLAFDNLTLTLESVISESLERARTNDKLEKEIRQRNKEGGFKLDLLMVGDHSLFEAFWEIQESSREHAYFAVQVYLEAVFDQIKEIYNKQVFFGKHKMKLNLSGVLVIEEERDCPMKTSAYLDGGNETFSEDAKMTWSIDALKAIAALSSWRALHIDVLPKHDHVVFVTKFDLLTPTGTSATQGMGFVQKMCDSHESVSVVEDIGALTTSAIAAHEIGHSLGAFHDGEVNNSCNPRSNYLMAPSASSSTSASIFENGFRLSNCSVKSIEAFMGTVESACLTVKKDSGKEKLALSRSSLSPKRKLKPGEQFGATRQCQIAFAPHYGECNQRQYKNLNPDPCRRLWCKNRLESRFAPCETKSYLPLMDGTECEKGKWCQLGNCVINEFFDPESECQDLNEAYCREKYPPAIMKIFCVRKSFSSICCRQCKKYNYYIYEKYRKAERRFKKKKIPPRKLKINKMEELSFNETDIDPL